MSKVFQSKGYVVKFNEPDEFGNVFTKDSFDTDSFMKKPLLTLDYDDTNPIGAVTECRINKKGVFVKYKIFSEEAKKKILDFTLGAGILVPPKKGFFAKLIAVTLMRKKK